MKFFLLYISLFIGNFALSQTQTTEINKYSVNTKFLEHLIKIKVDSVRAIYDAKPLINDSILYVASKGHADWMNSNNKFSHFEKKNPIMKTPQLRAEFNGAVNYRVGENIIKSYLGKNIEDKKGKNYINRTYADLAKDFVNGWVNSPPHFANIKTKEYEVTGVSISINKETSLVYAVQKFAVIDFRYEFQENKEMFSYSDFVSEPIPTGFDNISRERIKKKYAWKIKAPKDSSKRCDACNQVIDLKMYKDHFERTGTKMVLQSFNVNALEEIIQKRRDGLALEIVSYIPFDCGNPDYYLKPSRRNNQSIINGVVLKPIYKKELKRGFKKAKYSKFFHIKKDSTAKSFKMSLGKLPKEFEGYYEVNILVLKKKRVCRVIHFTDFCGENMSDSIATKKLEIVNNYPSESPIRKGVVHFEIPFKKGKYDFTYADIKPLIGVFSRNDFTVDSANVRAYSSMEGTVSINNKLQQKRAQSILSVFKEKQNTEFKTSIETHSNWYLFKKQIEEESKLKELRELDSLGVIEKLEDKEYVKRIEPFLSIQRYGAVDLHVKYVINLKDLADTLLVELKNYYFDKKGRELEVEVDRERVFEIQYKIYELVRDGHCGTQKLDEFWKILKEVTNIHWDQQYWLNRRLGRFKNEKEQYHFLINYSPKSFEAAFNGFSIALDALYEGNYYSGDNHESLFVSVLKLKLITPDDFKNTVDSMEISFYARMVELSGLEGSQRDDKLLEVYSEKLVNKTIELQLEEARVLRVAKLMVKEEQDVQAYNILQYQINKGSLLDETKVLFAKLNFYHIEEYHNRKYSESLIKLYGNISQKNWCGMFVGPCNISFQVFDDEILRNFYCEKCSEFKNYAQAPTEWITE